MNVCISGLRRFLNALWHRLAGRVDVVDELFPREKFCHFNATRVEKGRASSYCSVAPDHAKLELEEHFEGVPEVVVNRDLPRALIDVE